jgi:hypothetical protein
MPQGRAFTDKITKRKPMNRIREDELREMAAGLIPCLPRVRRAAQNELKRRAVKRALVKLGATAGEEGATPTAATQDYTVRKVYTHRKRGQGYVERHQTKNTEEAA